MLRPDPKPRARIVNPRCLPFDGSPATRIEGVRAVGVCPLCGRSATLNRAHVVAKGLRGDDVPENMTWICGWGTQGCHGVLTHHGLVAEHNLSYDEVAARFVVYCRQRVPEIGRYCDEAKYEGWLEDYYLGEAVVA